MAKSPEKVKRSWVVERKPFEREVKNDGFYNSWPWRKKRKSFLNERPLCVHCEHKGLVVPATVVDHIKPIRLGGEKLNDDNLQGLCETCHNSKSSKERGGMG